MGEAEEVSLSVARRPWSMRFVGALEGEFLAQIRADQRTSALVCSVTALVIWLGFMAADVSRLDLLAEWRASNYDIMLLSSRWASSPRRSSC